MIHQKLALQVRLSQKLILTPSLQQAIKLLPMSTLELADMLQQEITENPLLEESVESQEESTEELAAQEHQEAQQVQESAERQESPADAPEVAEKTESDENSLNEIDVEAFFSDYLDEGYRPRTYSEIPELPPIENTLATTANLADHLAWQLRMLPDPEVDSELGLSIIGNIDERGYLAASVEEICAMGDYSEEQVNYHLSVVQQFDPVGVAGRDLRECLLIQLRHLGFAGTPAETIVREHLELIQKHLFNDVAKAMGLPMDELIQHCEVVRRLDPEPGSKFSAQNSQYVTPDVYVVKVDGKYEILLNDDRLPRLRISSIYRKMLENKTSENEGTRNYVKDKLRSALWLIKSVDQRQKTIYKVASSIVTQQQDFMDHGLEHLRPMVLRDVAVDIGMHESTVSRVVTNKYIHTPQGVFAMKYFFHSGIASTTGDNVSSVTIKKRIRTIVSGEDPKKPLSDSKIVKMLEQEGLILARRTIAKYREELRIPPSNQRKNLYSSPFAS